MMFISQTVGFLTIQSNAHCCSLKSIHTCYGGCNINHDEQISNVKSCAMLKYRSRIIIIVSILVQYIVS